VYGCGIRSPDISELHKQRECGSRVLRSILVSKRHGIIGGGRKLGNEDLHKCCSSTNIIRMINPRI
jgi:hypothetical protein